MKVTFYGVRGSCPTPGAETAKYGGNTACVLVSADDGRKLILDAGTGIRKLGIELKHKEANIYILLTHNHWDHIQGFPFFIPAYLREHTIFIYPGNTELDHDSAILEQMSQSYFPVHYQDLKANIQIQHHQQQHLDINGFAVTRYDINHPGGGSAFIIECDGKKLAYITDSELNSPTTLKTTISQWQQILQKVDLLIHDAQFIATEIPLKIGWGHSQVEEAVALADHAKVKRLVLYSHDPARTDADIDQLIEQINQQPLSFEVLAAMEGMNLTV